ncbi:hypothetical protein ASPZODRAFT_141531 [Penicilliopsis zonata CBS 506.65]|uniref:Major facilitator superfamily (MFS) profile domain-containing protein n=1 Tax=Penicilliopsis zonata CBS 506.65 TaxID=1073090 RepID=A0A1L9SL87_9EURO|nr:hypothetical protein ASPZODRAFT_141531 [Penicilliopsis zonata CBS 506.65]OJJ47979.1 hypothetical protein ASPZODRAFT_141531 [Penicilliopsis zonata CBS 506.65]
MEDQRQESQESQEPTTSGYKLPPWRKWLILFIVSWMTLVVTFSSTSLLPAAPNIASDLATTSEAIDITNAGVLLAMGFSSVLWSPVADLFGRRTAYNAAIFVLLVCTVGAALAVDMAMFTVFRILGGFTGTFFMVAGQTILADIFEPLVRGTAVGCFMVGSVSGPAIGPCIGGIIVTFAHWRIIFWLQVGMTALGLSLSLLFVPTIQQSKTGKETPSSVLAMFNPMRILRQMIYPNVLFAYLTCGLLAFFQYAILTSARSIFNPRFHLSTALVSGLFYLAPGSGFLVGSVVGGRLSDRAVRKWILRRNGVRLPQDRLNSGLLTLFLVLPVATLIFGWTLEEEVGGMPVPIISAFFAGVGLMGSFNGLNTYAAGTSIILLLLLSMLILMLLLEVRPHQRSEVIAGKYIVQYIFGAASSAAVVPMIDSIGVGLTFTIGGFLSLSLSLSLSRC